MSEGIDFTHHVHLVLWNEQGSHDVIGSLVHEARENPWEDPFNVTGDDTERRVLYALEKLLEDHVEGLALDAVGPASDWGMDGSMLARELLTCALQSVDYRELAGIALESFPLVEEVQT